MENFLRYPELENSPSTLLALTHFLSSLNILMNMHSEISLNKTATWFWTLTPTFDRTRGAPTEVSENCIIIIIIIKEYGEFVPPAEPA